MPALGLNQNAQSYSYLINNLHNIFPECTVFALNTERSPNNINFTCPRSKNVLVSIRAAENSKKFSFNSDDTGLAVGFREDDSVESRINRDQISALFIGRKTEKNVVWNYYRLNNSNEILRAKIR